MNITSFARKVGWTALFCAVSTQLQAEVIQIADPGLEGAVRQALNKPTGEITRADMETLQVLDASRMTRGPAALAIQSFSGLEAAINLTALDCSGIFYIQWWGETLEWPETRAVVTGDFSSLAVLPNLRSLALRQNWFTNVMLNSGFRNLESLDLGENNALAELSLNGSMPNLQSLVLDGNRLQNLNFLAERTNLKRLDLQDNDVTNTSLLNNLPRLRSLDLSGNERVDLGFLSGMSELEELQLNYIGLTNIAFPGLTNLARLSVADNRLISVESLADLPQLRALDVSGNSLTSFPGALHDLTELNVSWNGFRDLSFLSAIPHLEKLAFSGNPLPNPVDLRFLETFSALRELTLGAPPLGNFVLPLNLANLELLSVQGASLSNIALSARMPLLRSLDLSDNQLPGIALPEAPELRELILARNQLKRLALPANTSHLTNVDVSWNLLAAFALPQSAGAVRDLNLAYNTIGELDVAPARESLITLRLSGNPIRNLESFANFQSLEVLYVNGTGLDRIILPEGLTSLKRLDVAEFCPDKCVDWFGDDPPDFLGIPASMHLDSLRIDGLSKGDVTILGFWIDELIHQTSGTVSLNFRGAAKKTVHVQHSIDLLKWETVNTMATDARGQGAYSSEFGSGQKEFFRVIAAE